MVQNQFIQKKVSVTVTDVRTSAEEKHSGDFTIAGLVEDAPIHP